MAAPENGGAAGSSGPNGFSSRGNDSSILHKIHGALDIVYRPYSDNQQRKDAQIFLEEVKHMDDAPSHGFQLASDKDQSPVVRHYALSLLEHAIKHRWAEYSPSQAAALRNWVLELSQRISREDPAYLRSKIAVLWVEIAKRSWASDWMDMDTLLVRLWEVPESTVHKELVLGILEMLSDEIFNGDDTVVAMREGVLSKASVEIFTPGRVLVETFPNRQAGPDVRCGEDGWLTRVTQMLGQCLAGDLQNNEELKSCAVRALAVIYSLMPWVIPNAVTATGCVPVMCDALRAPNVAVQKAALEALHALYGRTSFVDQEFLDLVYPLYDQKYIELFSQLCSWAVVDPEDIDDDKYQFAKKLSELISFLGNYLDRRHAALPRDSDRLDFKSFVQLLLQVTQSQSLVVSIPVLVTWTRLLNNTMFGPVIVGEYSSIVGSLLESCSSRLLRYESLPEDTQDATFLFLLEDTDTVPERHAFLGNYRRYSSQIIESIVRLTVSNALQHILSQTDQVFDRLYADGPGFNMASYSKSSRPVLLVDAQATVIEAALKGVAKWKSKIKAEEGSQQEQSEQERAAIEDHLESWCNNLLGKTFEDPLIRKRVLQLLVAFSTTVLDKRPAFVLKVLEHILVTWPATRPEHRVYTEAIKELQTESLSELQRLAMNMPDHLLAVYDQISSKVNEMVSSGTLDEKRQVTYQTFLFTIVHRASQVDEATKVQKLQAFVDPITSQWQDERLTSALSDYSGFCRMMALDRAQEYLAKRQVHKVQDWGSVELDDEGKLLQEELEKAQVHLPLRPTKSFLTCSVDKITKSDAAYPVSCALWQDGIPVILPQLLKFLNHAHAAHNPENWSLLPSEMRSIVGRVLTDRFWQAGISEGTKDDFYARVLDKKHTIEGLASTIRGAVRFVRETCYTIIYCMTRMDMQFYGFSELPGPLAHALLADSFSLSAHQLTNLLNLVRYLVDNCPVTLREHFLPPVLAACCQQMDAKVNSEWARIQQQQAVQTGGDALTEEMKAESILRQLTYTSVMMIADFLDPARTNKAADSSTTDDEAAKHPTLRKFCLMHSSIVEPLLMFCTHVIGMRDGRSCGIMLRVFRSIVPEFAVTDDNQQPAKGNGHTLNQSAEISAETASVIREYISSDVIKACITSIHEPYFVDLQKELASLMATIVVSYVRLTSTPRDVLLSLPNMNPADVDWTIEYMLKETTGSRAQRAAVLDLLRDLKGVSISEMGKLSKSIGLNTKSSLSSKRSVPRTKLAAQFMTAPAPSNSGFKSENPQDGADNLEGVANLFEG